jgi:hypothetical protein
MAPQRLAGNFGPVGQAARSTRTEQDTSWCDAAPAHLKSSHFAAKLVIAGLHGGDSMHDLVQADHANPMFTAFPIDLADLSDDECVARLARVIAAHDSEHLDEVAGLIGRLAIAIE